jgi:hypothetical protein
MQTNKNHLKQIDRDELHESGISDEFIALNEIKSISNEEAIENGFYATTEGLDNEELLLQEKYVTHSMYIPLFEMNGEQIVDKTTGFKVGVIKPRYTSYAIERLKQLPKYLCQIKQAQSRMYLNFPRGFDWINYKTPLGANKLLPLNLTEGLKKAIKACQEGIPCAGLWSVWCYSENKLSNSLLIRELTEFVSERKLEVRLVFDSDKHIKPGVTQAEIYFANKWKAETNGDVYKINLPQRFKGKPTKGLDDFLHVASSEEFSKLEPQKISTVYLSSFKVSSKKPSAPLNSLPDIFIKGIYDIAEKLEGSLEIAAMSFIASVPGVVYNVITCEEQRLNLYQVALAPTTAGKSAIARACFKPSMELNSELQRNYQEDLKNIEKGEKE